MTNYGKGRKPYPEWTEAEIATLRRLFPGASWPELLAALPGRTRRSIWQKGKNVEKIVRKINRKVPWTRGDDDVLRKNYQTASDAELKRLLPNHTFTAIQRRGSYLKIYRLRPEARTHERIVLPIVKRLYEIRLAKHMRRPELAKKLGYAHGQILAWELGKTNPEFRIVVDWAQALGLEIVLRDPIEVVSWNVVAMPPPKLRQISTECSQCQRHEDRIAELEEQFGKRGILFDRTKIDLTRGEATFLGLFLTRRMWTKESAYLVLYGAGDDDAPEPKILDVLLSHIRSKIGKHGIVIDTQRGDGWSITAENQAKLKALTFSAEDMGRVAAG